MRLWHKDLIPVLPDKQLLGQWRECCAIAKNIAEKGTPNHLLVNKVVNYSLDHLFTYGLKVALEIQRRGMYCDISKFDRYIPFEALNAISGEDIFAGWHNNRYLAQCYSNLEEKYDCGGIEKVAWEKIFDFYWFKKDWGEE